MKKANFKKLNGKAAVSKILLPIGIAYLGSIGGAAAGKTGNLAVAGALGVAAVVFDQPNLTYAAIGAAVVTPPKASTATAGIDGLDGLSDKLAGAKNRAMGQAKALLSNAKLDMIADKLPVSGLAGLGDVDEAYQQGYIEGVSDTVDELEGDSIDGLAGTHNPMAQIAPGQPERKSIEAILLSRRMA